MTDQAKRPAGVTALAIALGLLTAYLWGRGALALASPKVRPAIEGTTLRYRLTMDVYGPFLMGGTWGVIGWGLFRLREWARQAAMIFIIVGAGLLVPYFVFANSLFQWSVLLAALEVVIRLTIVWYLFRGSLAQHFSKPARPV
ncbi:MAG TPA: hypothetical protein VMH85_00115 [Terriglobales bacterium]|nr:hypothetical protein [Terriglobales bacterium]